MAALMGIIAMVRMVRLIPKKLTEAAFYGGSVQYERTTVKASTISIDDHMALMKRMAELEEKVTSALAMKPAMPKETEHILLATINRVSNLEQELAASRKVLYCWFF